MRPFVADYLRTLTQVKRNVPAQHFQEVLIEFGTITALFVACVVRKTKVFKIVATTQRSRHDVIERWPPRRLLLNGVKVEIEVAKPTDCPVSFEEFLKPPRSDACVLKCVPRHAGVVAGTSANRPALGALKMTQMWPVQIWPPTTINEEDLVLTRSSLALMGVGI